MNVYPVRGYSITVQLDDKASRQGRRGQGCWMTVRRLLRAAR
jgi:hypothetical protein